MLPFGINCFPLCSPLPPSLLLHPEQPTQSGVSVIFSGRSTSAGMNIPIGCFPSARTADSRRRHEDRATDGSRRHRGILWNGDDRPQPRIDVVVLELPPERCEFRLACAMPGSDSV